MGIQGPYRVGFAETFPFGAGLVNEVTAVREYDAEIPPDKRRQERDKVSGLPLWQVEVMDFDPQARDRVFNVRIAAAVQPVPPAAVGDGPVRPVVLEGLEISGYPTVSGTDRKTGKPFLKMKFAVSATGLSPVRKQAEPGKTDSGRAESGRAA